MNYVNMHDTVDGSVWISWNTSVVWSATSADIHASWEQLFGKVQPDLVLRGQRDAADWLARVRIDPRVAGALMYSIVEHSVSPHAGAWVAAFVVRGADVDHVIPHSDVVHNTTEPGELTITSTPERTVLDLAVDLGKAPVVRALLAAGADPYGSFEARLTSRDVAAELFRAGVPRSAMRRFRDWDDALWDELASAAAARCRTVALTLLPLFPIDIAATIAFLSHAPPAIRAPRRQRGAAAWAAFEADARAAVSQMRAGMFPG
jgi:hypothetical protein